MKKLLVLLCAGAFIVSACSSAQTPVEAKAGPASAPAKHKHHRHASGINCNK